MEVKVGRNHIDKVQNRLQFERSFVVDNVLGGGVLALFLEGDELDEFN